MAYFFLLIGLFFILGNFSSFIGAQLKKTESTSLMPLVGPICITIAILIVGWPLYYIPLAWVCDVGTVGIIYYYLSVLIKKCRIKR